MVHELKCQQRLKCHCCKSEIGWECVFCIIEYINNHPCAIPRGVPVLLNEAILNELNRKGWMSLMNDQADMIGFVENSL